MGNSSLDAQLSIWILTLSALVSPSTGKKTPLLAAQPECQVEFSLLPTSNFWDHKASSSPCLPLGPGSAWKPSHTARKDRNILISAFGGAFGWENGVLPPFFSGHPGSASHGGRRVALGIPFGPHRRHGGRCRELVERVRAEGTGGPGWG